MKMFDQEFRKAEKPKQYQYARLALQNLISSINNDSSTAARRQTGFMID